MTIIDKIKDLRKQYPDNTALFDLKTGNKITFTQIDTKSDDIQIFSIPDWAKEVIWYNIFPDRFYNKFKKYNLKNNI